MAERVLSHFAVLAFEPEFWRMEPAARSAFLDRLAAAVPSMGEAASLHAVSPLRAGADLLLWTAARVDGPEAPAEFLGALAASLARWRPQLRMTEALWGFTRPSQYHPAKSPQMLDPFAPERRRYLIVYPFTKTSDWYLLSQEARQGLMNEHIRVGKEYPDITQLLLYSTGLADQEFVVVYETDDLPRFSELVTALRATDGRPYTLRDTPITTAFWRPADQLLDTWRQRDDAA